MQDWLSEKTFYCAGLLTPQSVTEQVCRARNFYALKGLIRGPLEPFVPIWISQKPPVVPVPGLLPKCEQPVQIDLNLSISPNKDWLIWPVESFGWFELLRDSLLKIDQEDSDLSLRLSPLPLCIGIPVSPIWPDERMADYVSEIDMPEDPPRWHAMNIVCYQITPGDRAPWFLGFYWRQLWRRSLKRAP